MGMRTKTGEELARELKANTRSFAEMLDEIRNAPTGPCVICGEMTDSAFFLKHGGSEFCCDYGQSATCKRAFMDSYE
jgi:hypothetical protein